MNYPTEKLAEKFDQSPTDIQDVLVSQDVSQKIADIVDRHKLSYDQSVDLGDQISFVLLGLVHLNQFIGNIRETLKLSPEESKKIADEINKGVFQLVRDSLRKIHGIVDDEESPDTSSDTHIETPEKNNSKNNLVETGAPETRTDHILPEESEEKLLPGDSVQETKPPLQPSQPDQSSQPPQSPRFNYPLSTASGPIQAPPPPVSAFQTLEKDFDQVADGQKTQKGPQSMAEQKLNSVTGLPLQEKKFEIPDPKNRTYDPYREPID